MSLPQTGRLKILLPRVEVGDPHVWTDAPDRLNTRFAVWDALIRYDGKGGFRPALALNWALADDVRSWVFTLRRDAFFHDGSRLRARDVVGSLNRARNPDMAGDLGTQGLYEKYLGDAVIESLGKHKVRIATSEPMADLLDLLVDIPIVPQSNLDALPESVVGTGAYRVVELSRDSVVMQAFEKHWAGGPRVGELFWRGQPDRSHRARALLAGDCDLAADLAPQDKKVIEDRSQPVGILPWQSHWSIAFMCNLRMGPCADRRVRQALNYALDVPKIVQMVREGAGKPLNGPLTPFHLGYDPATLPYPYAPTKARDLLHEAGYSCDLEIILDVPKVRPDEARCFAQVMTQQYQEVGITAEIKVFADRVRYAEMVKEKEIDDACCFDSSPLSTYRVLREKFHSGVAGSWWQGYKNHDVDKLLDRASATPHADQRRALYRQAYRRIRDDAPWIFLYRPTFYWGTSPAAQGCSVGLDGVLSFK